MLFLDNHDIVQAFVPIDLQAAQSGDYCSLENHNHVAILIVSGLGTDGDDPVITTFQAKTGAGGSAKPLSHVTSPSKVWKKQAATNLETVTSWTDASGDSTTNSWDENDTSAQQSLILVIEFDAADLDADNGFAFIRADVADTGGAAQLGWGCYILSEPRFARAPDAKISPLT